jgi:aminopeptidase N
MNKAVVFLFCLFSSALYAQHIGREDQQCAIIEAEMKSHSEHLISSVAGFANDYNLVYQRCEWNVDPSVNFISGAITSYFKPTVNTLIQLNFDLHDSLKIDSVWYHQANLTYTHGAGNNDLLNISLPAIIPLNTLDSITVYYHGVPPPTGFGSFYQGNHNGAPVIWTLSEPYGAKDWWPCKQNLIDKIDSLDIYVVTPKINRVASNGVLVSETVNGPNKTFHWKTRYATAAYLVAIAVTNYVQYAHYMHLTSSPTDSLLILNYVYPEDLAYAQANTPQIIKTIALYDSLTIVYPFNKEKYGHAEFGWGGGMEHQTMSFVGGFSNTLISHECAHQWFGDYITLGSWEDIWLNEGFATYFEALTEERYFPENWMNWKVTTIRDACREPHGSVKVDDTTSVSRIFSGSLSYSKGAYLLHMLRWKLGDRIFFQALHDYLNDPTLVFAYARTPDLMKHLESASGQNLHAFFNEWFNNKGFPSYQIVWRQNNHTVIVTANQTQSDPSVPFFEMPIPIEFVGGGHDTTLIFDHAFSGQSFTAELDFRADFAYFDPQLHLLSTNNQVEFIYFPESLSSSISIYPNPAVDVVEILNTNPSNPVLSVEVFGVPGNFIRKSAMNGTISLNTLNVSGLAAGIYFLRVKTDLGTTVKRIEITE